MTLLEKINKYTLIAILRNVPPSHIEKVVHALYDGGIRFLEVTFDPKEDPKVTGHMIKTINKVKKKDMHVGAGTVINLEQLDTAYNAGAEFILSPNTNTDIIKKTKQLGLLSMPGALTPSEVNAAYDSGADIVKVFPAGIFGHDYIKAVLGPLSHIPLSAVGAINLDNMLDYLDAGVISLGIGSNMVNLNHINDNNFEAIKLQAELYVDKISKYNNSKKEVLK